MRLRVSELMDKISKIHAVAGEFYDSYVYAFELARPATVIVTPEENVVVGESMRNMDIDNRLQSLYGNNVVNLQQVLKWTRKIEELAVAASDMIGVIERNKRARSSEGLVKAQNQEGRQSNEY